jgi:hypothetical protein
MKIELPSIEVNSFCDFSKLINEIEKNITILKNGSNKKPFTFDKDIEYFKIYWLENKKPVMLNLRQLRSVSIFLLESKVSFQKLLEKKELLINLLMYMEEAKNISLKKRIIEFYFKYYFLLQTYKIDLYPHIIRQILQNYKGHNTLMNTWKIYIEGILSPNKLLKKFENIAYIKKVLNLSADSDFFKYLIILSLITKLKNIEIKDDTKELFNKIREYKNYYYDKNILIGDYAVRILIDKIMQIPTNDYTTWIEFIIDIAGDPRIAQNPNWSRIGEKYKNFLIKFLSKEDLTLFLEVLSDPKYDNVYKYRKVFWKPFEKYLIYAKLFINYNEFNKLPTSLKKRFQQNNSAYSFIKDSKRSFIYMDFGTIKVIEGTHNAKVRLYRDVPVSLERIEYDYYDFYQTKKAKELIIEEITHSGSEYGSWQNKVLNILKEYIPNLNINLKETLLN